ncbi:hypothetical protein [Flavobacterium sp.]|uniref:hypothetical protein n=1 Tax=Flavobacterium sp. TaxID=239 RepID=UPI003C5333EE
MKTKTRILGILLSIGLFISCTPKDNADTDNTPLAADDVTTESKIDTAIEDITLIVEDQNASQQSAASKSNIAVVRFLPDCAEVTDASTTENWIKIINFGDTPCTLRNGNTIKGKITVSFLKTKQEILVLSYKFENFYHNGNLITGDHNIELTNKSTATLVTSHPVMTHNIQTTVTLENGKKYIRTGTIIRELIEGYDNYTWSDNVVSITGNTSTTLPTGAKVNKTIIIPFLIKSSCTKPYPVKGSFTIEKNNIDGTVDFGDGECDNNATFKFKGITFPIVLSGK